MTRRGIIAAAATAVLGAGFAADATAQVPARHRSAAASRPPAPPKSRFGADTEGWFLLQAPDRSTAFKAIAQDYPDLFAPGLGGGGTAALSITLVEPAEGLELSLGPALSLDSVIFPGRRSRDLTGGTLTADDMSAAVLLFGPQLRLIAGPAQAPIRFLAGIDIGLGAVFWPDTGATLTLPGPPPLTASGDLYERHTGFAWRCTARAGVQWRISDAFALTATLFAGAGRLAAPRDVDDPGNPFVPAQPSPMTPFVAGFAIGLRWRAPSAAR